MSKTEMSFIDVKGLSKYFVISRGFLKGHSSIVKAVDDVTFRVAQGEVFALVGESGCGKTTLGRVIAGLIQRTAGSAMVNGIDIFSLKGKDLLRARKDIQVIFQNPFASLNPRRTVQSTLNQPFRIHGIEAKAPSEVHGLLQTVGLIPPESFVDRFPHQLSGGQRQRVCIARALALRPSVVIADEPVSSLDMSIRGQILNLMQDLQRKLSLTYLLITHDMSVVRSMADIVAVMYLGAIVEQAPVRELFAHPTHPYTEVLLSIVPVPDPEKAKVRKRIFLEGELPPPTNIPSGCRFRTRCPFRVHTCSETRPALVEVNRGHFVACSVREPMA